MNARRSLCPDERDTHRTWHQALLPPGVLIGELIVQLDLWRTSLPHELQWMDHDRYLHRKLDTYWLSESASPAEAMSDNGRSQICMDIGIADLRTRYYQAQSLVLRPYLHRLLHQPASITVEDQYCCTHAVQSMLWWPHLVEPSRDTKRLIPHHFAWTQAVTANLCLFAMIRSNGTMKSVCEQSIDLNILR